MVYSNLDSASILKSSSLALVQDTDEITISYPYGATSGTDTYTVTIDGVEAYTTGLVCVIKFGNANTGSSTLNINSLGAITLKKSVSTNLAASDISANQILKLVYDGTNFQVIGLGGGGGGGSGTVNSGTQYRIAYYATNGTAVSEAGAITASRALVSDANGVPTHSATTSAEIGYLSGLQADAVDFIELSYIRSLTQMVF